MVTNFNLSYNKEINRKKFHLLSLFIPIFYIIYPDNILQFVLFLSIIILIIDFLRITKLYEISYLNQVIRKYEINKPMTATYLALTSLFIIYFFDKNIAVYSLLLASISDTSAALYGMKYGNAKLLNNKTIEGTFAFIISGIISIYIFYFIINFTSSLLIPIFGTIVSGLVEHLSPGKYDNITVPLSFIAFMYIFI